MKKFYSVSNNICSNVVLKVLFLTFLFSVHSFAQGERNEKILVSLNTITFSKQNTKTSAGEVIGKVAEALVTGQISVQQKGYDDAVRASILKGISQSHRVSAIDGSLNSDEIPSGVKYYVDAVIPNISTATKTEVSSDNKHTTMYYKAVISAILNVKDVNTNAVVHSSSFNISDLEFSWFGSSEEALTKSMDVLSRYTTRFFNSKLPLTANIVEGSRDKKDKQKEVYIDLGEEEGAIENIHFAVYQVKTIAGKEARKQIGKLKIKEVLGSDLSLCKVQRGGKEIKAALDAGENILVISTD